MREKERIKRILNKIELIWDANPDARFGQLLESLSKSSGLFPLFGTGIMISPDLWRQEDEVTEKNLDRIIKELGILPK